jgi:hypothetical protein
MGGVSYAVVWTERGGPRFAGSLELDAGSAVLSGSAAGGPRSRRRVRLEDAVEVRLERRSGGSPVVVVAEPGGSRLEISSLEGGGALHELAEGLLGERGKAAG